MTYDPNIPAAGTKINQTFNLLRTNFQQANAIFNEDHYQFNDSTAPFRGKHRKSTYIASTAPGSSSGENVVFSETSSGSSVLYSVRDGNASTKTALTTGKVVAPLASSNGYSWLPGEILIQWGLTNSVSQGNNLTVNFPITFPNNIFSVIVSPFNNIDGNTTQFLIKTKSLSDFVVRNSNNNNTSYQYQYIAIGN